MNGTEQRERHTVVSKLRADTEKALEVLAEETAAEFRAVRNEYTRSVGEERTHRLKLAAEQRGYVDAADQTLHRALRGVEEVMDARLRAVESLTFFGRLRWFFTGRLGFPPSVGAVDPHAGIQES